MASGQAVQIELLSRYFWPVSCWPPRQDSKRWINTRILFCTYANPRNYTEKAPKHHSLHGHFLCERKSFFHYNHPTPFSQCQQENVYSLFPEEMYRLSMNLFG